ncbi:MAG TPA: tRNA-binding protein, partial [Candidatus Babeliales bacterium]|nr:tRNA-binding protein [Candidatus Babeliales bacterium]
IKVEDFPQAKKPAYKLWIDLGPEIGIKQSSAQITQLYSKQDLLNKQVICVVNFPPRQIATFSSEVLTCGFMNSDNHVAIAIPQQSVPNGAKLM